MKSYRRLLSGILAVLWGLYGNLVRHLLSQPYPLLSANLDKQVITEAYANPPVLKIPVFNAVSSTRYNSEND